MTKEIEKTKMTKETQDKIQGYVERLRTNDPTLTEIILLSNNITAPGAKDLAEALKVNHTLTQIDLSWNKITATGAGDLAEALKVNQTLTEINLWYNPNIA